MEFHIGLFYVKNYRSWRNNILMGFADTLDGLVRLCTLGVVGTSIAIHVMGWVSYRDCQRDIKKREAYARSSVG